MCKLNICLMNNLYPPITSGSSQYTAMLAKHLAERGHKVTVITAQVENNFPLYTEQDSINIIRLPCFIFPQLSIAHNFRWMSYTFSIPNIKLVLKIMEDHNIDIIHLNGHFFDLSLMASLIKKMMKIPFVVTIHAVVQHSNPFYQRILRFADKLILRKFVINKADRLIVPDSNYRDYVSKIYQRKAILIPYGVDYPIQLPQLQEDIIDKYDLNNRPLLVSLGHVHGIRDRCDLIQAMNIVVKRFPNAKLLIIGEIYIQTPLQLVEKLCLKESVIFTGPLPREIALSIVQQADIELHWARRGIGGLGIASLESMLLGKPVMAYPRVDLLDDIYLEDWKHLIIAPRNKPSAIADAICKLLLDPDLLGRIGKSGQKFVITNFSWETVCNRVEEVYNSILKPHND